jgi:hypothetical protein
MEKQVKYLFEEHRYGLIATRVQARGGYGRDDRGQRCPSKTTPLDVPGGVDLSTADHGMGEE